MDGHDLGSLPEDVQSIVLDELEQCREKIIERISRVRKLTDTEVYHAGVSLTDVVKHAQAYMKDVSERMNASAHGEDGIDIVLESIKRIARTQESLVSNALENLAGIANAGRQIREMSGASRLLALNARVESARFGGEGGRAFNVIADEMRELSQAVETTNMMVGKLAAKLQKALPQIQQQSVSMGESIESLVDEMSQRNKRLQEVFENSTEAGSEALEKILGAAQGGLGHLQFQDIMIQDLEGIERLLQNSEESVARSLGGQVEGQDAAFLGTMGAELEEQNGEAESESEIESGEVLLF